MKKWVFYIWIIDKTLYIYWLFIIIRKGFIYMKITLPETAVKTLKDILQDNQDRPQTIRVYFAGIGWGGPSFGIALDEQKDSDTSYEVDGLTFIMDKNEYAQHGDIVIEDTGFGFRVIPENMKNDEGGCGGGCSGCGQ